MAKSNKIRRYIYSAVLTGFPSFGSFLWRIIIKAEAGISFWQQLKSFNMMIYLDVFFPLILGVIAFVIVYWIFKIKDRIQTYFNRIENNHLIQRRINKIIAKSLDDLKKPELEQFIEIYGKYTMKDYINRYSDGDLSPNDVSRIIDGYSKYQIGFQQLIEIQEAKKEELVPLEEPKNMNNESN